jgi:hypothetical protein
MLIAGGHLEKDPLVVVAGDLWLEITTVSGDAALTLDENLNPVPGSATAPDWMVHLPAGGPLGRFVQDVANGDSHLSDEEPSVTTKAPGRNADGALNDPALARWATERA